MNTVLTDQSFAIDTSFVVWLSQQAFQDFVMLRFKSFRHSDWLEALSKIFRIVESCRRSVLHWRVNTSRPQAVQIVVTTDERSR